MTAFKNLTKRKFGRLEVKRLHHMDEYRHAIWECMCDCGEVAVVSSSNLLRGHTLSCGCLQKERASETQTKHGLCKYKAFASHYNMLQRCLNPKDSAYIYYGARGVSVCDRWLGDKGAENFLEDMGECPDGLTLERIDNLKGYSPDNCKWATRKEQANNRRNNRLFLINGEKVPLCKLALILGIADRTFYKRLYDGWTEKEATSIPKHGRRKKISCSQ